MLFVGTISLAAVHLLNPGHGPWRRERFTVTPEDKKLRLDNFLILHRVVCGSQGYSEMILPLAPAQQLVELCRLLEIRLSAVDFWCDCNYKTRDARGCPHGGGGYGYDTNGSYCSEMYHLQPWEASENSCIPIADESREILDHVDRTWRERGKLPCLSLGLYLITPTDWQIPQCLQRDRTRPVG